LPYVTGKLEAHMTLEGWYASDSLVKRTIHRMITSLRTCLRFMNVCQFILYLSNGRYLSFVYRVIGLQYVWYNRQSQRSLAFDVMQQTIAFTVLSDFFAFISRGLPIQAMMTRINEIKQWIFAAESKPIDHTNQLIELDSTCGCPLCGRHTAVNIQVTIPCLHTYCYYCLETHWNKFRTKWKCATCQQHITGYQAWTHDVETERKERREKETSIDGVEPAIK
jgi:uncharacterized membrane protein